MLPTVSVVRNAELHSNFRQFSPIFLGGRGALSAASCEAAHLPGQVLVAGEDRSIALLSYETGHVMRRWVHAHLRDINAVTRPLGSGMFASGSRDRVVKVWSLTADEAVAELNGHTLNVSAIDLFSDGALAVSGGKDTTVRLWDVEKQQQLSCAAVIHNIAHFVRYLPELRCVAQGGEDLTIRLWDVRTDPGRVALQLGTSAQGMSYFPMCCEVVPGVSHALITGHNGSCGNGSCIGQWDMRKVQCVCTFTGHRASVTSLRAASPSVFTPGSFFSGSDDGSIGIWSLSEQPEQKTVASDGRHNFGVPEGTIKAMESMNNGDLLAALGSGGVVVFRPQVEGDSIIPSKRFRYIGTMGGSQ